MCGRRFGAAAETNLTRKQASLTEVEVQVWCDHWTHPELPRRMPGTNLWSRRRDPMKLLSIALQGSGM